MLLYKEQHLHPRVFSWCKNLKVMKSSSLILLYCNGYIVPKAKFKYIRICCNDYF